MNCPGCGAAFEAPSHPHSGHCNQCGSAFSNETDDGVAVVGEAIEANCPVCRVPLMSALIETETVFYCGRCHGYLAHTDTFSTIVTKRRARHHPYQKNTNPFDPAGLKRVLPCPICHQRMDTHPYFGGGNAVVDTCENCSVIWLDAGDLAFIECYVPYVHQIERTLTLRGGRYQGGPFDMPTL